MTDLPAFFEIAPPPPELQLDHGNSDNYGWRRYNDDRSPDGPSAIQAAKAFPEAIAVDPPETLRTAKMFACSGSPDSWRYREATRFRPMPEMGWEEARAALNRLLVDHEKSPADCVRLGEFALTADGFAGFAGRKGDHAVKLRSELADAINKLHRLLSAKLETARGNAARLDRPITDHGEDMADYYAVRRAAAAIARAFWTNVPTASDQWVRVVRATPEQVLAALNYLRSVLTAWKVRHPPAASVVNRLKSPNLPTASEYAEAFHTAEMLVFASEKLLALYAGLIYSMPIYRLYPATAEAEAIALWWPWARPTPLVAGGPPRPPKPGKKILDPSLITATRPQDVVREVMQKTGIDRTTAQRMTAAMRAQMRRRREIEAEHLLHLGHSKSEVALRVGLSASRISAMFKGEEFPPPDESRKVGSPESPPPPRRGSR
jgi:hypothetical protein